MGIYQLGTAVTITETFSVEGIPTDPTTVVFTVQDPTGVQVAYTVGDAEVSNPFIGVYELALDGIITIIPGVWTYTIVGSGAVEASGAGDFTVLQSQIAPVAVPFAEDGPCSPWCDARDIWAQCGSPTATVDIGTGPETCDIDMTPYAWSASWLLWQLEGRLHSGRCEQTVRPCSDRPCGFQILSRGHIVWPTQDALGWVGSDWYFGDSWEGGCGCTPLDRIHLAGYPVREILEVKIDGIVMPEFDAGVRNWRLDKRRYLTRMADANGNARRWPGCQQLDLDDTEAGTFSVSYAYGQDAPLLGQMAAAQLGCELYRSLNGEECALPAGTVRVTRQGITIDKTVTLGWFSQASQRYGVHARWQTGLTLVDAFLNAVNPTGMKRRPVMMAPGQRRHRFAQGVGQ